MLKELEQLLKEISQQQGVPTPQNRPQTPQQKPPQRPPQQRQPQRTPALEPLDAEIVPAQPVHQSVTSHVNQDIDTTDITGRAAKLGVEVGLADEKIEAHLHEKFDHDLSEIDDEASIWDAPAAQVAKEMPSDIASMLRNPASIRQAVILSEILKRPDERW